MFNPDYHYLRVTRRCADGIREVISPMLLYRSILAAVVCELSRADSHRWKPTRCDTGEAFIVEGLLFGKPFALRVVFADDKLAPDGMKTCAYVTHAYPTTAPQYARPTAPAPHH